MGSCASSTLLRRGWQVVPRERSRRAGPPARRARSDPPGIGPPTAVVGADASRAGASPGLDMRLSGQVLRTVSVRRDGVHPSYRPEGPGTGDLRDAPVAGAGRLEGLVRPADR